MQTVYTHTNVLLAKQAPATALSTGTGDEGSGSVAFNNHCADQPRTRDLFIAQSDQVVVIHLPKRGCVELIRWVQSGCRWFEVVGGGFENVWDNWIFASWFLDWSEHEFSIIFYQSYFISSQTPAQALSRHSSYAGNVSRRSECLPRKRSCLLLSSYFNYPKSTAIPADPEMLHACAWGRSV